MVSIENTEIKKIIETLSKSKWDLLVNPTKSWLEGKCSAEELTKTIKQANEICGNCGCEYDALYQRALELLVE